MSEAFRLILSADTEFLKIVGVSLLVSLSSTSLATALGVPFGIMVARRRFRGRSVVVTVLNTLMSFPTVLIGLMVYSAISSHGPLGGLHLLYTRKAMIIGQFMLAAPIIAGLTVGAVSNMDKRIHDTIISLGADPLQGLRLFVYEARFGILAAAMAGFGRVFAEIGISMMLGGNIKGYTRTITTAIALETSKGEFALGLALGLVLLLVAFAINILFMRLQERAK